jgi:prepilin-type N-terminal cleavage/methylation domain-containing protein
MQTLHGVRRKVIAAGAKGFTLIEMMVVVAILSIVAVITFGAISQDKWEGSYRQFTEDVTGIVTLARNTAIDNQTQVRVDIYGDRAEMWWLKPLEPLWDPNDPLPANTLEWQPLREADRDKVAGGKLLNDTDVCIYGIYRGVIVDGGGADAAPSACLGDMERIVFFPDGHMEWEGQNLQGAGITIVLADQRTGTPTTSHVQVFPGGMVRKFDKVVP